MIIDGKKIKETILNEVKKEVSELDDVPKLVVIKVGKDNSSDVYIKQKKMMCSYVGYRFECIELDNNVTDKLILDILTKLNNDVNVSGILVQLPLPSNVNTNLIINSISPLKDVDGLTDLNRGKLFSSNSSLCSCTALGVIELLNRYNISVTGKNVVVVGRSNLVGKPLSLMLINMGATVTVCNSKTKELKDYTKKADILISAVGISKLITDDIIDNCEVIIDVGVSVVDGVICGDVDFEKVKAKVKYITPVPGGVGPMTVSMLAKNILKSYRLQKNDKRL